MDLRQMHSMIILFLLVITTTQALQMIAISVPAFKEVSEKATFRCMYDLGLSTTLYSIKWYKNGAEFYRYLPREVPQAQAFPVPGILVDLGISDEYQVGLEKLTLLSGGTYKCEVSAEAPVFHTVAAQAAMAVRAFPVDVPRIDGLQGVYSEGDIIDINCTSSHSKPATELIWFLNGKRAAPNTLSVYGIETDIISNLDSATLGLKTTASKHVFQGRVLSLRCTATLGQRSWQQQQWTTLYNSVTGVASRSSLQLICCLPLIGTILHYIQRLCTESSGMSVILSFIQLCVHSNYSTIVQYCR